MIFYILTNIIFSCRHKGQQMGAAFLKNTYWNSERKSRFLRLTTSDRVLILLPFDCSMNPSTYTRCVSSCAWFRLQCHLIYLMVHPNAKPFLLDNWYACQIRKYEKCQTIDFLETYLYSIFVELHCIGNHYKHNWSDRFFFVIVKLTYLIRDFVTNASILVIRFTIFPVFCFAMLKLSSLINFNKL